MPKHLFCSDLSRQDKEELHGTASLGETWLLLEYPGHWAKKALAGSHLSKEVKAFLKALPHTRILLIRQNWKPPGPVMLFVAVARERDPILRRFELRDYNQIMELGLPDLSRGEAVEHPLFLVCTHGKRDKCCAKYGCRIYNLLRSRAPGETWQCSHVGGDRFAANLVCFPHGLFYGHVNDEDALAALDCYQGGRIYLNNYRGRACFSRPIQAAETFIRRETGIYGLSDFELAGHTLLEPGRWRTRFTSRRDGMVHEVVCGSSLSPFQNLLTCSSTEPSSVIQYQLLEYVRLELSGT